MIKKISVLFFILSIVSCTSLKKSDNFSSIIFGQGGGISGQVKGFEINSKAHLYSFTKEVNGIQNRKFKRTLTRAEIKEISKKVESANALSAKFQESDNYYYFIETEKKPKKNYICWGGNKMPANEIKELYDYLYFISN